MGKRALQLCDIIITSKFAFFQKSNNSQKAGGEKNHQMSVSM